MHITKFISGAAILVLIPAFALGQAPAQSSTELKHVPITRTASNSGKEMFNSYCAVCHGTDGEGNGPAASAMKNQPKDLTGLAQEKWREVPHRPCRRRDPRTSRDALPWQRGHAGLGSALLQHQPGTRS